MSKKRHEDHEEHENHERWLVSYADMMTLLFALFVVLYAISSLNKSKIDAFASSMVKNKAIGQPMITTPNPIKDPIDPKPGQPVTRAQLEKLKKELEAALAHAGVSKGAKLQIDAKGLEISLTDGVLYDSGQAVLLPNGRKILTVIGPKLKTFDNPVTVEGHTDNTPIRNSRYPDNWELSSARANTVVRFFLAGYHLDPERMQASGFADTHPLVRNDSPTHKATNRRVVVTIVAPASDSSASTAASTETSTTDPASTGTGSTETTSAETASTGTTESSGGH